MHITQNVRLKLLALPVPYIYNRTKTTMEPNYPDRGLSREDIKFGITKVYRDFESEHQMNDGLI